MVERIYRAVTKARAERAAALAREPGPPTEDDTPPAEAPAVETALWSEIEELELDQRVMERSRIVSYARSDPAHISFDVLRTRLLKLLVDNSWSRIAVTSSAKGAGKTFVCLNLALALARYHDCRVMLIDLDLRAPGLAKALRYREPKHIDGFLTGSTRAEDYFYRIGERLLVGLNTQRIHDSSELVQSDASARILNDAIARFDPDVVLYDLPPLMVADDAIGVLQLVDCALLVAAAGETRAREISECERLILEHTHLLGVILNKGEKGDTNQYGYS